MLVITGTVRIDPERIEQARPAMRKMVEASRAEPGCQAYSYAQDLLDPGLIHVIERWDSREALTAHFTTPHMAEWRASFPVIGISDRDLILTTAASQEAI